MPTVKVTKVFTFDSAHYLTKYHGKCEKLHGHTYKLEVTLEGKVQENGMVVDFALFKNVVKKYVVDILDHKCLNDFLDNPSSENLVIWMWEQLTPFAQKLESEVENPNLPEQLKKFITEGDIEKIEGNSEVVLKKIKLWETPTSYVTYKGK